MQVALHRWLRSDTDRALHDHSANNISILLTGPYREWYSHAWEPKPRRRWRLPLLPCYRYAEIPHRVELTHGPVWTLWIRMEPRREWGFWCAPTRWVHWRDYLSVRADTEYYAEGVSQVGRGCD